MESKLPIISMRGVMKSFPGVLALDDMTLDLYPGEVHVLIGENGAGKSTLVKILSGVYKKDSGDIALNGEEFNIEGIKHAQSKGISIIHQELNLLPHRTVYQNIYLGREEVKNKLFKIVDENKMIQNTQLLLDQLGVDVNPRTMVKKLSIAQRQMVEVAKALSFNAKVLIMDEPTSSLTEKEVQFLFQIIRKLRENGVAIVYISHRMEELQQVGDKVTVMRDGKLIGTHLIEEVSLDEIIEMMIGRKITNLYKKTVTQQGPELLRVENLSGLRFKNISLHVNSGEIVSLSGLVGSGRTEIAKSIFGYDKIERGYVFIKGEKVIKPSTKTSTKLGVGFLPEDRRDEGLILNMPIEENILLASLSKLFKNHIFNGVVGEKAANRQARALSLSPPDIKKLVMTLSGGNQQKVVLAKWLCKECRLFIFDEPTRGVDIGSKAEIYELMGALVKEGAGILMISSDLPEVVGLSDRVYVTKDGVIVKEFSGREISQSNIGKYAIGEVRNEHEN